MKLTTFIVVAALVQVSAKGLAQKITLNSKNTPIENILQSIREQSGYGILYDLKDVKDQRVTLNLKNVSVEEAIKQLFDGLPFTYEIVRNNVLLKKNEPTFFDKLIDKFQAITVRGHVVNEAGEPMSGVTVKVKGSNMGTLTNAQGRFAFSNVNEDAIITFAFIGYVSKQVKASSEELSVTMVLADNALNEVVAVGYGTAKRKDLVGSVSSINLAEVRDVPFASFDQALAGKAAGMIVTQADGSPGGVAKIRIRGGTSLLGGNDPLYIIDGVPVQVTNNYQTAGAEIVSPTERGGSDSPNSTISGSFARGLNSLAGLNLNDIETIDILKDASSTAIYGSRAANGVVIITTKKGKTDMKPTLDANYYTAFNVGEHERVLSRDQYIMLLKEGATNLNKVRAGAGQASDPLANEILNDPNMFGTANTDWMDLVTRVGITQNADLSVRGGGKSSRYYTSVSYNNNQGSVIGTDFNRVSGKLNLDNDVTSRLRISTNLDFGFSRNNITNGIYTQAQFAPPTFDPYNADGTPRILDPEDFGFYAFNGFQNPLVLTKGINRTNSVLLIGSLTAEYNILKDLKFRSSGSVNYNTSRQNNYVPSTALVSSPSGADMSNNGMATQAQSQSTNTFIENQLIWDKVFANNHNLNILAGTEWQIAKGNRFSVTGQGFPDDEYLNNISSAAVILGGTGLSNQNSLLSFYARGSYNFKEKYYVTFTGRSDASSKFSADKRVGYFPSGGVAWRISQEGFLKNVDWISDIKLRASAGYTGTQNIGDNLFYTLYSPVSFAGMNGLAPTQLGNDALKWESTLQKDAGIEFAFFNSRIRGGLGYYEKKTSGILYPTTVAGSTGFTTVTSNIATIRNRGLEFEFNVDLLRSNDWSWSGTINISGNRSKVLSLSNKLATSSETYRNGNTTLRVGQPLGLLYGRVFDKILQTQAEVDAYKAGGFIGSLNTSYIGIGDPAYKVSGTTYLLDKIGNAEPKYFGGFTNRLGYKGFTLTTLATFSYGGDILYLADIQNQSLVSRTNKTVAILDRWTPDNPSTTRPKLVLGQGQGSGVASNNVFDASYLKLKSVSLSYVLPKSLLAKLNINFASVYVSGTNLITVTKYPGVDPEVSNDPYSLIGGYSDAGGYPYVRNYSLGVRFGF